MGCGGGLLAEECARLGLSVTGIDPSTRSVRTAREHARESGLAINYLAAAGELLPFADGSYDVVFCCDVLEHLEKPATVIAEISRVLKPNGLFLYDTINRTLLARALLIWYGENFPSGGLKPGIHNYQDFIKPIELRAVLTISGLQVRELKGFMPRGFAHGHVTMGPGWFMGVSYVGYATKGR